MMRVLLKVVPEEKENVVYLLNSHRFNWEKVDNAEDMMIVRDVTVHGNKEELELKRKATTLNTINIKLEWLEYYEMYNVYYS